MKRIIKNIAAPVIFSGLFFIPVLSSAQSSEDIDKDNNNRSQAEIEAAEDIQKLENKSKAHRSFLRKSKKIKNRIYASISSSIYKDRSQAEIESAEELNKLHMIFVYRNLNQINLIQANYYQSYLNSGIIALIPDEEGGLRNLR